MVVKQAFEWSHEQLPSIVKEDHENHTVWIDVGKHGLSVEVRDIHGVRYHRVRFTRYGAVFYGKTCHSLFWFPFCCRFIRKLNAVAVPVQEEFLIIGKKWRPLEERMRELLAPTSVSTTLPQDAQHWSTQGSDLDRYIKALWLAIADQRRKLESLGIPTHSSDKMFHLSKLIQNVDKICQREWR